MREELAEKSVLEMLFDGGSYNFCIFKCCLPSSRNSTSPLLPGQPAVAGIWKGIVLVAFLLLSLNHTRLTKISRSVSLASLRKTYTHLE